MAQWAWWQLVIGVLRRVFRGKSAVLDGVGDAGHDKGWWPTRKEEPKIK